MTGDVPEARVNPSCAFVKCGVDYAGPYVLSSIVQRSKVTIKGYLAIFVCFTYRAVHLEVVRAMTTEAFLGALQRFISRRGLCREIYSKCRSNFKVVSAELRRDVLQYAGNKFNECISNYLADNSIQWKFNPPGALHIGGLWEAGVKSAKHHLHRVVCSHCLTLKSFPQL